MRWGNAYAVRILLFIPGCLKETRLLLIVFSFFSVDEIRESPRNECVGGYFLSGSNTLRLAPPSLWISFSILPLFLSWFSTTVNASDTSWNITPHLNLLRCLISAVRGWVLKCNNLCSRTWECVFSCAVEPRPYNFYVTSWSVSEKERMRAGSGELYSVLIVVFQP